MTQSTLVDILRSLQNTHHALLAPLKDYTLVPYPQVIDSDAITVASQHKHLFVLTSEQHSNTTLKHAWENGLALAGYTHIQHEPTTSIALDTQNSTNEYLVELNENPDYNHDEYDILVHPTQQRISVEVGSTRGAQYAGTTLGQLLRSTEETHNWLETSTHIHDKPRFTHRGVMLDVARSYLPINVLHDLIFVAARLKLTTVHLHLVDDQAWRLEITNNNRTNTDTLDYTRLHSISGQTAVGSGENPEFDPEAATTALNPVYDNDPNKGFHTIEAGHGGYYTQEEMRELVELARSLHIDIIPELEFPGHNHSVLHALPELATQGAWTQAVDGYVEPWTRWQVGYSYLDYQNPATWTFAEHVMREYGEVFGYDKLHLGGDECYKLIEDLGQERYNEILEEFVDMAYRVGFQHVTLWQEGVVSLRQSHGSMQLWNYTDLDKIRELLDHARHVGARIINSDARHVYLDQKIRLSDPLGLTWAVAEGLPTQNTYEWDPLADIPQDLHDSVDGIEACLWGETVRTQEDVAYLMLPRLAAIAEVAWSAQEERKWDDISRRLGLNSCN